MRAAVGGEHEPETLSDDGIQKQPEEAARLDRHPEPSACAKVEAVEGLDVRCRDAAHDADAGPFGDAYVATMVPGQAIPVFALVGRDGDLVMHERRVAMDGDVVDEPAPQLEQVELA